jgi:2-C-methyl-D-erythritol 4-phosphate cytidylyltransferase
MKKRDKNVVIITAGGAGKRLNAAKKKQFLEIEGRSILEWTILPFLQVEAISEIIITLPSEEVDFYEKYFNKIFSEKALRCIAGGKERQESVFLALQSCAADTEKALIHDGVRPFVRKIDIEKMMQLCQTAIIPISPVKYTLKQVKNGKIIKTVPREEIFEAHTPQIFSYPVIWKFHQKAKELSGQFTDDASILEYFGIEVDTYETKEVNLKITTQEDLELAKYILLNRR